MNELLWQGEFEPDVLIHYLLWPDRQLETNKVYCILVRLIKGLIFQIRQVVASNEMQICDAFEEILEHLAPMDNWGTIRSRIDVRRDQNSFEVGKLALYAIPRPDELLIEDPRDLTNLESELINAMRLTERAVAFARIGNPPEWKPPNHLWEGEFNSALQHVRRQHADVIRDIFGNPFRPVTFDPRWLSSSVVDLARTIYYERAFEHMPILADALMDAGCDSETLITHCHNDGPHVRSCWVVDQILGKA